MAAVAAKALLPLLQGKSAPAAARGAHPEVLPSLPGAGSGGRADLPGIHLGALWRADEFLRPARDGNGVPSGFAALDAQLPEAGWPQGQLIEVLTDHTGIGELGLLLPALAGRAGNCVWVLPCQGTGLPAPTGDEAALPYAPALSQAGIDPSRHLFVRPGHAREALWALEQSLRSDSLGAVLGWLPRSASPDADFRFLRRLHLLAQRSQALVFVLRPAAAAASPSPASLRLQLAHEDGHLQVRVLKRRGRPLLEPVALQVHPQHWGCPLPAPAARRPGTPAPASRPALLQRLSEWVQAQPGRWADAFPAAFSGAFPD
jgi:cell division inhibitor SulA/protein ImuA